MGEKQGREPRKITNSEVLYSETYDDVPAILSAEQVVVGAYRQWVAKAGLGERRAQNLTNRPEVDLSSRERTLVVRAADTAIASANIISISPDDKRGA